MLKNLILLVAVVGMIGGLAACSKQTCPTYSQAKEENRSVRV